MGADPDLIADAGYPALHWAVVMNKIDHLKILIELGADVKAKTSDFPLSRFGRLPETVQAA